MMKRISLLVCILALFFATRAFADVAPVLTVGGVVKQPLSLTMKDLEKLQPVCARLNEVGMDGSFHGVFEYRGVPLRTILDMATIQKEGAEFSKPVDLAVLVKTRDGKETLLSWGEIFYRNPAEIAVAFSATPIMPMKSCQGCHKPAVYEPWLNELKRQINFPKLVMAGDFYTERCLEGISGIEVVDLHPKLEVKKSSPLFSPGFNITGSVKETLNISDLSGYSRTEVWAKQVGDGKGFHGLKRFEGVPLIELLNKAGIERNPDTCVLVSAPDGYRSLFSYGELLMAASGKEIIAADRVNGEPLRENGMFILVCPHDLAADRWIKAVDKIKVITYPAGRDSR